ncbi:MAG: hypothetical protein HQL66_14015 [Magnetococcales bacterium]|nr:hypothetical protein [Magnetococcales bacterium]
MVADTGAETDRTEGRSDDDDDDDDDDDRWKVGSFGIRIKIRSEVVFIRDLERCRFSTR